MMKKNISKILSLCVFVLAICFSNQALATAGAGGGGGGSTPCVISGTNNDLGTVAGGDDCFNAPFLGALDAPCACDGGTITPTQVSGTTTGMTSENPYVALVDCGTGTADQANPATDVWYAIQMTGQELNIDITGMNDPNVGIYEGSGGCGALVPRGCAIGSGGSLTVNFQNVFNGEIIYIQVSGGDVNDVGDFTMTLSNNVSCVDCILADQMTMNPAPINGTYQPGQTVNFCYAITEYSQENTNWLHGVVPVFGAGWDQSSLTLQNPGTCDPTSAGTWTWFNNVSTPSDGNQDGWFFDSTNDGDPSNNYGDNCSGTVTDWNFCWSVDVQTACAEDIDLSMGIMNYADGETGSWIDLACTSDANYELSAKMTCCEFPLTDSVPACPGMTNGSATVTGQGASPFDYAWSTGFNENNLMGGSTLSNVGAGTYTVIVTDDNGCTKTQDVVVTELPAITITPVVTPATCAVPCDGAIANTVAGGATPYQGYAWSSGQTSEDLSNICGGTYTITVTDNVGCTMTSTSVITTPPIPTVTATTTAHEICDADCAGAVSAATAGGTAGFTYAWSGGATTGLCDGNYTVTVTDGNGCTSVDATTVNPGAIVTAVAANTNANVQCLTGNSFDFDAAGSSNDAGTTYTWNFGDGNTANGTTASHTYGTAATFTVTLTVALGTCVDETTVQVTVAPMPTVTLVSPNPNCALTTGEMTATGAAGDGNYAYTWSNSLPAGAGASQTQNNVADGNYTVTVTDNTGCTATAAVAIVQPPAMTITQACTPETAPGANDGTTTATVTGGQTNYSYNWTPSGGNVSSQTNLAPNTYTVTATDANGCTIVSSCVVNPQACAVGAGVTVTDVSCNGGNDGTGFAQMTGSVGSSWTYTWSPAAAGQNPTNLTAANYSVTITDNLGCTASASGVVNEPAAMTITTAVVHSQCFGDGLGSIDVNVLGGTPGYTFSWNDAISTEDRNGISGGTYSVTATDNSAAGCTISTTAVVTEPTQLVATISATDITCNAAADGTVSLTVSGGTTAYGFAWATLQTAEDLTGLGPNTYTVTITDGNGCSLIRTDNVAEPGAITITTGSTPANCGQTDGSVSASAIGGAGGYTYDWGVGTGSPVNGLGAANYTVTVTDAQGCTNTEVATINNLGGGTVTIIVDNHVSCNGVCDGQATANMLGGTTPYTYAWASGGSNPVETGLCAGAISVTVTDNVGCVAVAASVITEPDAITSGTTKTDVSCNGYCDGTATVTGLGGTTPYTYLWDDPAPQATQVASNLCAGMAHVTITDFNGCEKVDSAKVEEPFQITITTTSVNSNCNQADGALSASAVGGNGGPFTYDWGAVQNATYPNLVAAAYPVTVTDALGCTEVAVGVVTDNGGGAVTVAVDNNVSCFGACDGQATATMTGGTTPYTYAWSGPNGGLATQGSFCAGAINVTVTDGVGCIAVASDNITEPAVLGATASMTCVSINGASDGSVSVAVTGGTTNYSYQWNDGGNSNTAAVAALTAGPYEVTVTDANGCSTTANTVVCEPTPIVLNPVAVDALCNGGNGSVSTTASGGITPYNYVWVSGGANVATGSSASGLPAGIYAVSVTDLNGANAISANVTIGEPSAVTLNISSQQNVQCFGDCDGNAQVDANGGTSPYTYNWSSGANTPLASNLCAGTYTVSVQDNNNCPATINATITSPTQLVGILTSNNLSCFGANDGTLDYAVSGGTTAYNYVWSNASAASSQTGVAAGIYCVSVTDGNGCEISACTTITEPSELVLDNTATQSTCQQSDGSATVLIVSGDAGFTFQWGATAGNQTTATASNVPAGNYPVTVTDGNGCTEIEAVGVTDAGAPTISVIGQGDVSCFGGSNGFAQVNVAGGTSPYNYQWDDPASQQTASVTGLPMGTWCANMTDADGCVATTCVDIAEPTQLVGIVSNETDVTCFGASDGTASVIVSGGTSGYNYQWSDGNAQTTATAVGLAPGGYSIAITDAQQCNTTITANIGQPAQILLTGTSTPSFCAQALGSACPTITNGVAPFSYNWSNGQVDSCAALIFPGDHILTVTDGNQCTESVTITVGDTPAGVATISNQSNELCFNSRDGSAEVSIAGATTPYTYLWSDAAAQQTAVATGLGAGTYCVTVTDDNGCEAIACVTLTPPVPLANTILMTEATCKASNLGGLEATTTGGATPYTYAWSAGIDTDNEVALAAGIYTVTITDANGCTMTDGDEITTPDPLVVDSTVVNSNCNQADGSACVGVTGGLAPYAYVWNVAAPNDQSCIVGHPAGGYFVTVTDDNLCEYVKQVIISDIDGPTAQITATTHVSCFGGNDGSSTVEMVGGTGGMVSVTWSDGLTTYGTNPTAGNLPAGTYTGEIVDDLGCIASAAVTITEPTEIIYNPSSTDPSCFGYCDGEASVSIAGGTTPYTLGWSTGANNVTAGNDQILNLCDGTYSATLIDANGCQEMLNYTLTEPAQLFITVTSNDVNCNGGNDGNATAALTAGGVGTPDVIWDDPADQSTLFAGSLSAGVYNVTITDATGCFVTGGTTINEPQPIVAQIDANSIGHAICYGDANGYATVQVLGGGVAPYEYLWDGTITTAQATGLAAGVHVVVVTDANGCTVELQQVIDQPELLSSVISPYTDVTCFGECDGTATVLASGGRTPYFFQWNLAAGGQTAANAIGICADDNVCVTVTDATGQCTSSVCVDINEPTELVISSVIVDAHCGQFDGEIDVTVEGGTYPYAYNWNGGLTGANPTAVHSGGYTLNILDANGCPGEHTVGVQDIEGPTVTALSTPVACAGESTGTLNFTVVGGTPGYDPPYWWIDGNNDTLFQFQSVIGATGLAEGPYICEVTDSAGCKGIGVGQVSEPNPLVAFANTTGHALCFGSDEGVANVVAAGGNDGQPYTYSWNDPDGQSTTTATGLSAGLVSVVVTDHVGCSIVVTTTITQPEALALAVTATDAVCNGDCNGLAMANVTGGVGPYNYLWNPNAGPNSVVTNLCAQDMFITVTDVNGCKIDGQTTVNEPNIMTADIAYTASTCGDCNGVGTVSNVAGGNAGGYTYQWTDGQQTAVANGLCDQGYDVVVSDNRGCTVGQSVTVTDLPPPTVSISTTEPACYGQPSGTATASVVLGGNPSVTYAWSANTNSQSSATAVNLAAGVYDVLVTDGNGCTATAVGVVTQPNPFQVVLGYSSNTLCAGQNAQIWATPTGGTPNYTMAWGSTTPGAPGSTPYTVTPPAGTQTFYSVTATDANGCVESAQVGVVVSPELNLFVPGQLSLCIEQSESICVSATGGQAIDYTFTWSTGEVHNVPGEASSCINVTPTENTTVTVVLTDGCSAAQTGEIPIVVNPLPVIAINSDNLAACPPFDPGFHISYGQESTWASIQFDIDYDGVIDYDTVLTSGMDVEMPHLYEETGVYSVWAQVTSDSGCVQSIAMSDYITVYPEPDVQFTASPMVVTQLNPVVLFNGELSTGASEDSLWWQFDDGNADNGFFVQNSYQDTGSYWPILTGVNEYGCMDVDSLEIIVEPDFALYTPNAFTPNGDGLNDMFFPKGIGIDPDNFEFFIFDRWGEVIFKSNDPDDHWDGTARAKGGSDEVPTGVYIWKIKTGNIANKDENAYVGHVTLLR